MQRSYEMMNGIDDLTDGVRRLTDTLAKLLLPPTSPAGGFSSYLPAGPCPARGSPAGNLHPVHPSAPLPSASSPARSHQVRSGSAGRAPEPPMPSNSQTKERHWSSLTSGPAEVWSSHALACAPAVEGGSSLPALLSAPSPVLAIPAQLRQRLRSLLTQVPAGCSRERRGRTS